MLELDARLLRDFVQTPSSRGPSKIAGGGRTPDRSPRDPTRRPDAANGFENLGFDFSSQTLELRFRGGTSRTFARTMPKSDRRDRWDRVELPNVVKMRYGNSSVES